MKIVLLTGSPRKIGNSNYLANEFKKGAQEAGHSVFSFDCARHDVGACLACNHCNMNGSCVQKDDFEIVRTHILDADMIVFASPLYYFSLSAQIKTVIDRFYAINSLINRKKTALLLTFAQTDVSVAEPVRSFYDNMCKYLQWENKGMILASGVWTASDVRNTRFVQDAYQLGKNID